MMCSTKEKASSKGIFGRVVFGVYLRGVSRRKHPIAATNHIQNRKIFPACSMPSAFQAYKQEKVAADTPSEVIHRAIGLRMAGLFGRALAGSPLFRHGVSHEDVRVLHLHGGRYPSTHPVRNALLAVFGVTKHLRNFCRAA